MSDGKSFGTVIGNQIHWELLVESQLVFVEQADDGADAMVLGFFDPSINYCLRNLAAALPFNSRSASPYQEPFDCPPRHSLFLLFGNCNFSVFEPTTANLLAVSGYSKISIFNRLECF